MMKKIKSFWVFSVLVGLLTSSFAEPNVGLPNASVDTQHDAILARVFQYAGEVPVSSAKKALVNTTLENKPLYPSVPKRSMDVIRLNDEGPKRTLSLHFKKNVRFRETYQKNHVNYLSTHEANTLVFPARIQQIIQPPLQVPAEAITGTCQASGSACDAHLIYTQGGRAVTFTFHEPQIKRVQLTVFLANGHALSLHFELAAMPGGVMFVPTSIAGPGKVEKSGFIATDHPDVINTFDQAQVAMASTAIHHPHLNNAWIELKNKSQSFQPYKELRITSVRHFARGSLLMNVWHLCGTSTQSISLTSDYLVEGNDTLQSLFGDQALLSATLTANTIDQTHCADLITVIAKNTAEKGWMVEPGVAS